MNTSLFKLHFYLLCAVLLVVTACQPETTASTAEETPQLMRAPNKDDDAAWREYLLQMTQQHMGPITTNPFVYYLEPESSAEFTEKFERQVDNVKTALARGVAPGHMLAFGSSASARMADLLETAFESVDEEAMKGVRVVFIGEITDNDRVQAAVQPSGADYVFVVAQ